MAPIRLVYLTSKRILSRREKRQLFAVGLSGLLVVLLEMIGLGLFIPTISVLTDNSQLESFRNQFSILSSLSDTQIIVLSLLILVSVFLLKNAIFIGTTWFQRTVIARLSTRLTQELFTKYLSLPYSFHQEKNSSELIRNMQNSAVLISGGLDPFMSLITDGLLTVGILSVLIAVEPIGSLVVLTVFGCFGYFFQRMSRRKVSQLGESRNFHTARMLKQQQQGLGAIKEIMVSGTEDHFESRHLHHVENYFFINRTYGLIQQIPRTWLEMLTVSGLASLVLMVIAQGREPRDALPILSLFGVAAFRLQPSMSRIMLGLQSLAFSAPVVRGLYDDLGQIEHSEEHEQIGRLSKSVDFENVTFRYQPDLPLVLDNVSCSIRKGEKIGLVGASGAGKSTLVDLLLGLRIPTSGRILADEMDINRSIRSWRKNVGYVPQDVYLLDETIEENVVFGRHDVKNREESLRMALNRAQLMDFIESLPLGLQTLAGERGVRLSGGQRQRIGIARALFGDPEVLIFDEATSALDVKTEEDVLAAIRAAGEGKTVVSITHRITSLSDCSRVFVVKAGKLTDLGKPDFDMLRRVVEEVVESGK